MSGSQRYFDPALADEFAALGEALAPREDFVRALDARLQREAQASAQSPVTQPQSARHWSPLTLWYALWWWIATPSPSRRSVSALAIVILALSLTYASSPGVFAETLRQARRIAGLSYEETSHFPSPPATIGTCSQEPCRTVYQPISVEDANRYHINLPTWAPAGFVLDGVSEDAASTSVSFRWHNAAGQAIYLYTMPAAALAQQQRPIPVGPGSTQEITINGVPGTLIGGMWNSQTQHWDQQSTHFRLNWVQRDRFYGLDLHTDGCDAESPTCRNGRGQRTQLTVDDIIRMAESIP